MNKIYRLKLFKALAALLLLAPTSLFAGAPKVSEVSNPIAQILLGVVVALAICIVLLASVVLSAAQLHLKKIRETEKTSNNVGKIIAAIAFMFISSNLFAAGTDVVTTPVDDTIAGLKSASFYGLISAIIAELIILFFLIYNLRFLLKAEKIALETVVETQDATAKEPSWQKWWDKANSFRPLKEEAQIDLGHDYDGIRELDNRLPGWWLYGFYLCIIVAGIYLWRFHVSHTGLSSKEELQVALAQGEKDKEEYLKNAANNVDENTVVLSTSASDIDAGKTLFQANCIACHGEAANGLVNGNPGAGPNLTDDYWLHSGGIKDIFKTIKYGWPDKGMKSWKEDFSPVKIAQLASFIKSMHGKNATGKEPQGVLYADAAPAVDSTKPNATIDTIKITSKTEIK